MGLMRAFLEAARGLYRTGMVGLVSVLAIAASLLVLGVFGKAMSGAYLLVSRLRERVEVDIYLRDKTDRRKALGLAEDIAAMPGVAEVHYIDKAAAAAEFNQLFGAGMLDALSQNPLPTSIRVRMAPGSEMTSRVRSVADEVAAWKEVEDVDSGGMWVDTLDWAVQIAAAVGFLLGGVLCLSCVFAVSNTAKLMVLAQREAIEIMRLVGATGAFVRMTFLVGGGLQGLFGGVLAAFCLSYVGSWWSARAPDWSIEAPVDFGFWMIILGAILGILGSWASLNRVLNAVAFR